MEDPYPTRTIRQEPAAIALATALLKARGLRRSTRSRPDNSAAYALCHAKVEQPHTDHLRQPSPFSTMLRTRGFGWREVSCNSLTPRCPRSPATCRSTGPTDESTTQD